MNRKKTHTHNKVNKKKDEETTHKITRTVYSRTLQFPYTLYIIHIYGK